MSKDQLINEMYEVLDLFLVVERIRQMQELGESVMVSWTVKYGEAIRQAKAVTKMVDEYDRRNKLTKKEEAEETALRS